MRHARQDYQRIIDMAALGPEFMLAYEGAMMALAETNGRTSEQQQQRLYAALHELTKVLHPSVLVLREFTGTPIGDDEPVFLLRAMDRTAPQAVRAWGQLQYEQKGNREMGRLAVDHAVDMETWGREHGAKVADLP